MQSNTHLFLHVLGVGFFRGLPWGVASWRGHTHLTAGSGVRAVAMSLTSLEALSCSMCCVMCLHPGAWVGAELGGRGFCCGLWVSAQRQPGKPAVDVQDGVGPCAALGRCCCTVGEILNCLMP
jgi:hypothetical protein